MLRMKRQRLKTLVAFFMPRKENKMAETKKKAKLSIEEKILRREEMAQNPRVKRNIFLMNGGTRF